MKYYRVNKYQHLRLLNNTLCISNSLYMLSIGMDIRDIKVMVMS
jgi:hypothetical protein